MDGLVLAAGIIGVAWIVSPFAHTLADRLGGRSTTLKAPAPDHQHFYSQTSGRIVDGRTQKVFVCRDCRQMVTFEE